MVAVQLMLMIAPPLVLKSVILPCWECYDFEAAMLHGAPAPHAPSRRPDYSLAPALAASLPPAPPPSRHAPTPSIASSLPPSRPRAPTPPHPRRRTPAPGMTTDTLGYRNASDRETCS